MIVRYRIRHIVLIKSAGRVAASKAHIFRWKGTAK